MEIPLYELQKICRICLKSDLLVSIFSPSISFLLIRPIEMIEKLNIFQPDDNLPTLLCQSCLYRLLDAWNLQKLAEESKRFLTSGVVDVVESTVLSPTKIVGQDICDMFESNVTPSLHQQHDTEVETSEVVEDVLNDIEIDVSSLTRSSEADDTLSGDHFVGVGGSSGEDLLNFSCSSQELIVQTLIRPSSIECKQQKTSPTSTRLKRSTKFLKSPDNCLECGKTFNYPGYLEAHMRTHTGEKPFKCKLCLRSFTQASNLRLHQRTHTGERRRFQCEICAGFFTTSSNLKAHRQTHLEQRDYQCSRCESSFKTMRELRRHEPVHSTKDIICDVCQKAFTKPSYLSAHMTALHRGIRRHKCTECSKVFGNRSNLTCHMRTHTGEKPFQCKFCAWKFNQSSALTRHMRKHTKSKLETDDLRPNQSSSVLNNSLMEHYLQQPALISTNKSASNSYTMLHTSLPPHMDEVVLEGTDSTLSSASSLHAYDFTKNVILDFSTNQQHNQTQNLY